MSQDFVIDLLELERGPVEKEIRPGQDTLEELFTDLGDDFELGDPSGFGADLRIYKERSTVYVDGVVRADFKYRCGRCLTRRHHEIDKDVEFVLMSEEDWSSTYEGEEEIALEEADMDVSFYEGNTVDLGPLFREAILLDLPVFPQCPDELRDSCDEAYEKRVGDETIEEQEHQKPDLRWWPLRNIELADDDSEQDEESAADVE
ncbi:MAG: YceD family protein [Myxococcota bacterium]